MKDNVRTVPTPQKRHAGQEERCDMIERERIDTLKSTVDLVSVIQSRGIVLKKRGKSLIGLCPFHKEKEPSFSVTPSKNEWHCFGCDKGGDVIRFVELFDQVDFKEAVKRLSNGHPGIKKRPSPNISAHDIPNYQQYIDRVADLYANNFTQTEKGKNYLEGRGITDAGLFSKHHIGFCNGRLTDILPEKGEIRDALIQAGILYEGGAERYLNCVMFPVTVIKGIFSSTKIFIRRFQAYQ